LEDCFSITSRQEKKRLAAKDGAGWDRKAYEKSIRTLERGIELMETEGMGESDALGIFYTLAVEYAIKLERHEDAFSWAEKAVLVERKCLGEDSNEYQAAYELRLSVQVPA
jgi:hypothetical protein